MLPTMGINALTGGTGGLPYIFSSAAGNKAAEARAGGANEDLAFTYGLSSGALEAATEKMFDGIPGMRGGWLDDLLAGNAETNVGRALLKAAKDSAGEGVEEIVSGLAQPFLAKMWNGDERGVWQTFQETLPDALYSGLVGALSSALMSLPGSIAEIGNAYTVDTARDGQLGQKSVTPLLMFDGTVKHANPAIDSDTVLFRMKNDTTTAESGGKTSRIKGWTNLQKMV